MTPNKNIGADGMHGPALHGRAIVHFAPARASRRSTPSLDHANSHADHQRATLEMHFHAAPMDLFRDTFGLGPTGSIEFFKYSPQLEKFGGFDQAYVKTEMTGEALFDELEAAASTNGYRLMLTDTQLVEYERTRDIGADLLQSVREMKAGQGKVVHSAAIEARKKTGLSQSQFAALLGVSVGTLQGRKQPSGAARTLLAIARTNPKAVLAVAEKEPA